MNKSEQLPGRLAVPDIRGLGDEDLPQVMTMQLALQLVCQVAEGWTPQLCFARRVMSLQLFGLPAAAMQTWQPSCPTADVLPYRETDLSHRLISFC